MAGVASRFGGPVRIRVSRQLGYKIVKYITSLTVTDNIKQFGKGLVRRRLKRVTRGLRGFEVRWAARPAIDR
jgi:DMSO/TMAO reductase YedYZ molybdopterin-dependent catalytic subunit